MTPPRAALERWLDRLGIQLDVVFDVDLGQLVRNHYVVARGVSLGRSADRAPQAELFYEFAPGIRSWEDDAEPGFWYWMLRASDDLGTEYSRANNGTHGTFEGGKTTIGSRDLGGEVPGRARRLVIDFQPPTRWTPSEPWRRQLVIDLSDGSVVGSL